MKYNYNVTFFDQALQRKFEYDKVIGLKVYPEYVELIGFDSVFEGSEAYRVTIHEKEYTYFKVRKEVINEEAEKDN